MSRKNVLSHGNFGMVETEKQSADLALREKTLTMGRVVDLRRMKPGVLAAYAAKTPNKKRSRAMSKANFVKRKAEPRNSEKIEKNRPAPITAMALFEQFARKGRVNFDSTETFPSERANIVAIMKQVEAVDAALKNYCRTNIASEMTADLPEITDIERYLWGEAAALSKDKQDVLAELLAEPDVETVNLSIEVVNNPTPPPLNLRGGEGGVIVNSQSAIYNSENENSQSDFLARWRQKNNGLAKKSFIPEGGDWQVKKPAAPSRVKFMDLIKRDFARQTAGFLSAGFLIYLVIFGLSLAGRGLLAKENILSSALSAYKSMLAAKDLAANLDFDAAGVNFETAYQNFLSANRELNNLGRGIIYILEKLPGGSPVGSGAALVAAGENFAQAGQSFSQIADIFLVNNLGVYFSDGGPSLTQKIAEAQGEIARAQTAIVQAGKELNDVDVADLPPDIAPQVIKLKSRMAPVIKAAGEINNWSNVFFHILGGERAKKYLLVFQNNSEARPTGGFIGTYGLLDLDEGRIKNLFIDGIFNLDGQLYEKITPPRPIQKISTAWSIHDANWFADWPTSARKIMIFYEKAGGQTVDGVISLTPTVVEKLLAITGPISLPQYDVALDQNNFLDLTQYKVEIDYDKAQNQPKKILADFAPLFLEKLWLVWPDKGQEIVKILAEALAEKHILFYFTNATLEKAFADQGWTGEILPTEKDYLSVINTNINGYKTDKVVEQKIYHSASVQSDGSIIDTVKITRWHNGGQSQYDWYNKVNADYLRVYVPLGSKLISAQGQTLEAYSAPIDYAVQNFKTDADVVKQESNMQIDPISGTEIFEESGKTVFANWAYVSPGETVEITYQYTLPFKIDLNRESESYGLLAQKQAGSVSSQFASVLQLPEQAKITWQYPNNLQIDGSQIKFSGNLRTDEFYGVVLTR